jgi:hypothetical protein
VEKLMEMKIGSACVTMLQKGQIQQKPNNGHRKTHCDLSAKAFNIFHNMKNISPADETKLDENFKNIQAQ